MDKVRIGIAGMGVMGTKYAHMLMENQIDGGVLNGVYSSRLNEVKKIIGEVPVYTDINELYDSGDIDGVIIATPHYYHCDMAMEALDRDINILCEKPIGVSTEEVNKLYKTLEKSKGIMAMMFNQRTNSMYKYLKDVLDSGQMGEIRRTSWIVTNWYRTQEYYESSPWRGTWNGEGGGVLINQCPHNLDLWQWICGMPKSVYAFCHEGKWHDIEVEDDVTAYVEYPNGATGTFITSTGEYPGSNRLEISCDRGKLLCEDGKVTKYTLKESLKQYSNNTGDLFAKPEYITENIVIPNDNLQHRGIIQNFVNAILYDEQLIASGEEGIKSLELSNGMYLSSWLGKKIDLPLDSKKFNEELDKRKVQ